MEKQQKFKCFICDEPLTEKNSSLEHVILNSCGGKLKSTKLLCKKCNNRIGTKADSELSQQLSFFSTFLNIDRDRGELQKIKGLKSKAGEEYTLLPGDVNVPILSKPDVRKETIGEKTEINITTSDMETINKLFKDLKNKYPAFDIEKAKTKLINSSGYFSESLELSQKIGGELAFRSIVKSGIEFFILSGGDSKYIKHLTSYLIGESKQEIVWFAPFAENPYDLNNNEVSHFMYVKGDSQEKVLYAYIDFFNAYSFIMCLNDNYDGDDLENTYCYDLINNIELKKEFNLHLDRKKVLQLTDKYQPSKDEFLIIQNRVQRTFSIADNRQASNELSRIIKKSLETTIDNLGQPEKFTEDEMNYFIDELIKNYMPFFIHRNKRYE